MNLKKKSIILILVFALLFLHIVPLTAYADNEITIHFDTAGGTEIEDVVLSDGQSMEEAGLHIANPEKEGYTFFGWYYADTFEFWEKCYDIETEHFSENSTMYALFIPNENVIKNVALTLDAPVVGTVIEEEKEYIEEYDDYSYYQSNPPVVKPVDADAPFEVSYTAWITTEGGEFKNFYGEIEENKDYLADISIYLNEESLYRFSSDCTITINGEAPIDVGDVMDTWVGVVGKVRSTTEAPATGNEVSNEVTNEVANNVVDENTSGNDVSSEITFVEPEENTTIDQAAAQAVEQMVEDIVEGKDVEGIDEELKQKIQDAITQDKPITVEVSVTEVPAEEVEEDAKKVEGELSGEAKLVTLYNIDVVINIDGEPAGNVTKTAEELNIVLPVPENLPEVPAGYTRVFTIYKVHDGVATKLATTQSGENLTAKSSEFSTYAITYEDVKEVEAKSNPKTGDQIAIYVSLLTIALIGITATIKAKNK